MAFIEPRDPEPETTEDYRRRSPARICYEELQDHGLAGPSLTAVREAGVVTQFEILGHSGNFF